MGKRKNKTVVLEQIRALGYSPIEQGVPYHYKDGRVNFWPTTGKWYNENSGLKGKIETLPRKENLPTNICRAKEKDEFRYYKLDKRYLPDWVLAPERQERLKHYFK